VHPAVAANRPCSPAFAHRTRPEPFCSPARAGSCRVGIGVVDLTQTIAELRTRLADVPNPLVKPGVIATVLRLAGDQVILTV
jgi:hypothetical protein